MRETLLKKKIFIFKETELNSNVYVNTSEVLLVLTKTSSLERMAARFTQINLQADPDLNVLFSDFFTSY